MAYLLVKYLATALVVVIASEVAKRTDKLGALIASLPLVTIMVMIWLHLEHQGHEKIAKHAFYTFWYVLPTLPMFLLMPWLMSKEVNFWLSLLIAIILTITSFCLMAFVAKRFGISLLP